MSADQSFFVVKIYMSVDDVKKDIDVYNEVNFTNFVVSMNNKKSWCSNVQMEENENQKAKDYLGCEASINLYKSQKSVFSMKMKKVHLCHNHTQYWMAKRRNLF